VGAAGALENLDEVRPIRAKVTSIGITDTAPARSARFGEELGDQLPVASGVVVQQVAGAGHPDVPRPGHQLAMVAICSDRSAIPRPPVAAPALHLADESRSPLAPLPRSRRRGVRGEQPVPIRRLRTHSAT